MDGASKSLGSRVDLILTNPKGVVAEYVLQFAFKALNNQAEYEVLLARLRIAKKLEQKAKNFHELQTYSQSDKRRV